MNKLQTLTVEELSKLTSGHDLWTCFGSEKLGLRSLLLADGPHGVRVYKEMVRKEGAHLDEDRLLQSTLFPSAVGMASTFNPKLIEEVGSTIGKECNMFGVDVLLAPGLNLKRSPLGGRNFEYYSEDPYLTGIIGNSFVKGVQKEGVGATIKHFALNEQETYRRFIDTHVDQRTMFEFYFKPFKMVIEDANPYCVMTSYNKINGDYASESSWLLQDVLRKQWGYEGVIMSDWGAVQNKVKSIKNGMNLEMPGPGEFHNTVFDAIHHNTLTREELEQSLQPLFTLHDRLKENKNRFKKVDFEAHHSIANNVAEESIVLLKNNGILPLTHKKIGVVGSHAMTPRINGGGSASLRPYKLETPLEALKTLFEVEYQEGYIETETNEHLLSEVHKLCEHQDVLIFFTGTTKSMETEGLDKEHMSIPKGHIEVFNVLKKSGKKIITILNNGSALDLRPIQESDAIIEAWFLGGANGFPIARILEGSLNPSGRLSETFPLSLEHTPHYKTFPSRKDYVRYYDDFLRVGYRYYDTHDYKVLYPFGYGLSYSEFMYQNFSVSKHLDFINIQGEIQNTSSKDGKEVIQVYLTHSSSAYNRPKKELIRFEKVDVKAKEVVVVSFTIPFKEFEIYDEVSHSFKLESGTYKISIGKNVSDILYQEDIYITSNNEPSIVLTKEHPINFFKQHKKSVMDEIIQKYRDFPWHEAEEPLCRVMNRLITEFRIESKEVERLYKALLESN